MSRAFEELARESTPIGEISLRRRLEPTLQIDVFEVILADDGLMSSLFTAGEEALATLGLAAVAGEGLDVIVGGLGLGYTARAVLEDERVRSLHVVDALAAVIGWHERHLVPLGAGITGDRRCHLVHGDFFRLAATGLRVAGDEPALVDAILVDIDHSPAHLLDPSHAGFYEPDGLRRLLAHLRPSGVFALWSNDPPDDAFTTSLRSVFATADAHVVTFANFLIDGDSSSTIYVARAA